MPILSLLHQEMIIIDRIEHEQVIIEWEDLSISSLPIERFPILPKEGDMLQIIVLEVDDGMCRIQHNDPVILQCSDETLYLPIQIDWHTGKTNPIMIEFSISL
jgi:hypothetical protein